jgi:hypothetical protein
MGYGSFHVAVDTVKALAEYNESVDGYVHITRAFGEGSGPRFREVGRALGRLGVPDLRRHEVRRPLYALPLVDDPTGLLLGWAEPKMRSSGATPQEVAEEWWGRWVSGRAQQLFEAAEEFSDLTDELVGIVEQRG